VSARTPGDQFLRDVGPKSSLARRSVGAFVDSLQRSFKANSSGAPTHLFEAWRSQFGVNHAVAARKVESRRARIGAWRRSWLSEAAVVDEDVFLFAVQSYAAAALKLVAAKLAGISVGSGDRSSPERWRQIESGELYRKAGLENFVAGDVFQAVSHCGCPKAFKALADLCAAIHDLNSTPTAASIRGFHLSLFPRAVRHALGEYYTPEWLVSHILDAIGIDADSNGSILDPMCGGGVFLTGVLERRKNGSDSAATQCSGVAGIELHPLTVLVARTATLAGILSGQPTGDLESPISLPIYQGDAILAASSRRSAEDERLDVLTPIGILNVADDSTSLEVVESALRTSGVFGCGAALFENARAIRRSPQFEFVAGNPPWVGWETLPDDYRSRTAALWNDYGLFAQRGMSAILGGGKKDLSMLATYAAADRWLKPGGVLAFVLSESAFKSVGAARGFRRFQIGSMDALRVVSVDDLTRLNPFANAATRSTVLVLKKGESTEYPVPVAQWRKSSRREALAEPTDDRDPQSAWLTASPSALPVLRRMLGRSEVRAYEGVNTGGANGVYWVRVVEQTGAGTLIVENVPARGRTPAPPIRAEVESTFVFPLLQHGDAGRWRAAPTLSILLLQDPERRRGVEPRQLESTTPMTYRYIRGFEALLRRRAAFQRYFQASSSAEAPYYSMFNVGRYTLAPHKVVWRRMIAPPVAAVVATIEDVPILPQETLCFIPCTGRDESFFYAGLINSTPFAAAALAVSQGSSKSFGGPHLLELVCLPTFNSRLELHQRMVECARGASIDSALDGEPLDQAAASVFRLAPAEAALLADERDFLLSR